MKQIFAIAKIAIRNAIRSRVVVVLLGVLLLAIIGLPLTVKGDGTLSGKVQILLTYTLGAVGVILSIATIWAGCAAVSQEIETRQIHLVITKPVSRLQVWLGKWLGLLLMDAFLLVASGVVIYGLLRWNTRPAVLTSVQQAQLRDEILVARRVVNPELIDVEPQARRYFEEQQRKGLLPADSPPDQVYQAIKESMLNQAYMVPSGYVRQWKFNLPQPVTSTRPLYLRYKFSSSQIRDGAVEGLWLVGPPNASNRFEKEQANVPEGEHSVAVPAEYVSGSPTIIVEYANINPVPVVVLFDSQHGLQLMTFEGEFESNFVRSLLVMFCQLAFLGALAVSAGTLVSLPVAALATAYVVLLIKIGDYMQALSQQAGAFAGGSPQPGQPAGSLIDVILRSLVAVQGWIVRPLQSPSPLEHLAVGELVGWDWVGAALLVKVVLYSGALAFVAAWLFNRREIGLPT